ncbi:HAMP domain-containing protein, partial [Pseudomonas viridiflava]|uniref:HAMP domain-containing protein n=1 Tax=Pseudomonas viridiflava TaxID=33069 RepID=UPI000F06C8C1
HKLSADQSIIISDEAARTILVGTSVMLASALLVGLLALWMVNRNIVAPIRMLIEYVAQLSEGKFADRVDVTRQDELGRLEIADNTPRDFLADTFSRLKR